jgi:hypothetical protein
MLMVSQLLLIHDIFMFNFRLHFSSLFSGKGVNIFDIFTSNSDHVVDGSTGQVACNSYNFYQKDVEALKSLGVRGNFSVLVISL